MKRLVLVVPAVAVLLAGCASSHAPTEQQPRSADSTPPTGYRSVGYHGVGVDVPDGTELTQQSPCGGGLPDSAYVMPLFDGGATSCPAQTVPTTTPPPRPDDTLAVVLAPLGTDPAQLGLTDPRTTDDQEAGVTVVASGPKDEVDTVLASVRPVQQDADGCAAQVDPSVAPSNTASDTLVAADVAAIAACEYAMTDVASAGLAPSGTTVGTPTYWLVASTALDDAALTKVTGVLRSAPAVEDAAAGAVPFGPVLRLLVRGADGNTRTLQAVMNTQPEPVTDGQRTVGADADGYYPPIPTPFDGS